MPLTIISGCPGSGKTTLASTIASSRSNGVHIATDTFFRFIAHRIDPSLEAAGKQNQTVVKAFALACAEFSAAGYDVFVDGVIGPWMFPILVPLFGEFDYVLLSIDLDTALERVKRRATQASATPEVVLRMHSQFAALEHQFTKHVIAAAGTTPAQLAAEYEKRAAGGQFRYVEV